MTGATISIYDYMVSQGENGVLPADFSLPREDGAEQIRFADGAKDGIGIYHMARINVDTSGQEKIEQAIRAVSNGDFVEAKEILAVLTEKYSAIHLIDDLEGYIIDNHSQLNANQLHDFAMEVICHESQREMVKIGLEILEVFPEPEAEIKTMLRLLGQSDEFTLFVLFHMEHWQNGNEEIFRLAKIVHGWGRIHAIERLVADTEEIKDWLLFEGVKNKVLPDYSALTCYEKADVAGRLKRGLYQEEYSAVGNLLSALLAEGPVTGISAVEDGNDMLLDFVQQGENQTLSAVDYQMITEIRDYAIRMEQQALFAACEQICSHGDVIGAPDDK